jgi:hypothetical protein
MFNAVDLYFRTGVFAEEYPVARLHIRFYQFPVFRGFTLSDGNDKTFHGFLLGGVRDDDSALGFGFFLYALYDDSVL